MIRRLILVAAVLLAVWVAACLVLFVWPPAETGGSSKADAVIVLSGAVRRLPPALALIRRDVAPILAISSVSLTPKWKAARRLCRAGQYHGARVICFLAHPYSTRGEARAIAAMARRHHWHSVVVVSSTFHLTRVKLLVRRCYAGRLSLVGAPSTWWSLPADWVSETGKLIVQLTVERGC